ncbi:MAG: alpha-(1-_6)-mannopyranosyltransferase A [Thermoleophilaceae bacterium]
MLPALSTIVLGSLVIVLAAAERHSVLSPTSYRAHLFPSWLAGPLRNLAPWLPHGVGGQNLVFSAVMLVLFGAYMLAVWAAPAMSQRALVTALAALHAVFFLSPPQPLTDVFNYLNYGRMGAVHGLNPYAHLPASEFASDPAGILSNWHHLTSPYGQLFTLFTYALTPLGVPLSFWVFKALLGAASVGVLRLVWVLAGQVGRDPVRAVALVGLNPLVLVWGLGGDHNDFFMVVLLLGAVNLMLSRRERLGAAALVAAVAVKASAGALLPPLIFAGERRARALAAALVATLAGAVISLLAFGAHGPGVRVQSSIVSGLGGPNIVGLLLGRGGADAPVRTAMSGLLVLVALGCGAWAWRRRAEAIDAAALAAAAFLVTVGWSLPWYVLWLLPFAALARRRRLRIAALVASLYLMVVWLPSFQRFLHHVDWYPTDTPVGHANDDYTKRLLR